MKFHLVDYVSILLNLVLNDFCEEFKLCFIYSFIDIKTWVSSC
jgi:hypothetical protein